MNDNMIYLLIEIGYVLGIVGIITIFVYGLTYFIFKIVDRIVGDN